VTRPQACSIHPVQGPALPPSSCHFPCNVRAALPAGVVHGIAGLSNAQVNCWPLVMISGSCEQVGE